MPSSVKPGDVLLGKYRVERVIGKGGMGMVLAARHLRLDRLVAIKLMHSQALVAFDDARERFRREARAVASLNSENIARVTDHGELEDGSPFIIMEYLEGVDLATVLRHRGAIATQDAVDYMIQACSAMIEAHSQGIIHRDLKPANLFLTQLPSGAPLIKVLDFGISKYEDSQQEMIQTSTVGTMGSPLYMSPEQSKSAKFVDERSDIWSLGVILYHLLSGHLPFVAGSTAELFVELLHGEPTPITLVAPWVPQGLADVVMRCLRREPDERFQQVSELSAALAPFASEGGQTFLNSAQYRAIKMGRHGLSFAEVGPEAANSPIQVQGPEKVNVRMLLAELTSEQSRIQHGPTTPHLSGESVVMTANLKAKPKRLAIIGLSSLLALAVGLAILIGGYDDSRTAPAEPADVGAAVDGTPAADTRVANKNGDADTAARSGDDKADGDSASSDGKADDDEPDAGVEEPADNEDKSARKAAKSRRVSKKRRTRKGSRKRKGSKSKKTDKQPALPSGPFDTIR